MEEKIPWLTVASPRKRWLVGVSGGADSVALLHLLARHGFTRLVVCHLDHRLRGRASTGDARFVLKLADSLGFPCESGADDISARMRLSSESMETAARNARHEFFALAARKHKCRRLLLAHHADDQAETVLWNLLRGSHGLRGMRPDQKIIVASGFTLEIHRPLLGVRRGELVSWLKSQDLMWREDATNSQPVAIRNRLRNEAIPLLDEISGRDSVAALARGAADTMDQEALESWALEKAKVLDPQDRLHVPVLKTLPVALRRIALRKFLIDHGVAHPERDLIDRALEMLEPGSAASVNLPSGRRLRRREARLWVEG